MKIIRADITDLETVKHITYTTIKEIYPRYYPKGAVDFFIAHHSEENIRRDIADGKVYLIYDDESHAAGIPGKRLRRSASQLC